MRDAATWAVPVFIGIVAAWFLYGWIRGLAAERRGALTALFAAGGAPLVNQLVLQLWERPRPFQAHPGAVTTLVSPSTDGSFPSDHAAAAVAIAAVLVLAHRRVGAAALALAALVCVSRVYVGAHYALLWWPLAPLMAVIARTVDRVIALLRLPLPDRSEAARA